MYIAEVAPAKWRGRLVGLFQFNIVFGILLAYFSNYIVGTMSLALLNGGGSLGFRSTRRPCSFCFSSVSLVAPVAVKKKRVAEAREVFV